MPEQPPRFYKNPAIATILSLFLPGLGQLYNGEYGKGFGLLVLDAISVGLISSEDMSTPGIFIAVVVWIIGMVDANNSANRINGQLAQQTGAGNPRVASNPSAGGEYRNCPARKSTRLNSSQIPL